MRTLAKQRRSPHSGIILIAFLAMVPLLVLERQPGRSDAIALEPVFSHPEGYYEQDILLKIDVPHPGADILFTLDGAIPTPADGARYTQPIRLGADSPAVTVIRARAALPSGELGPVANASYFFVPAELPILSFIVDPADLWDPDRGLGANPHGRGKLWERPVDVTYLEAAGEGGTRRVGFHVPAGLRIHGHSTRDYEKKSFRLYFRQEYGLNRLNYPLFATSNTPDGLTFKRLVVQDGGQDFSRPDWTLIRAPLVSNLVEQTDGYTTQCRPVLLFINGEPQGIYQVRNYIDDWFLADKYGIEVIGDQENSVRWEQFLDFLETHNLTEPANYAYVQSQLDVANFVDYNILQIYAANTDWIFTNMRNFRQRTQGGRWRWIFWDVDWSFGLVPWSNYDFDMMDWFYHNDRPGFERNSLPFLKLLENADFRASFLARTADLLNTALASERVVPQVDLLAAELRPDIQYEIGRWPSSSDWEANVQRMRDFVRRRPDALRQHLVDHFGLVGTAELSFNPPAEGEGMVAVNAMLLPDEPWEGVYFQGTVVNVTAVPEPGYRFAGWTTAGLPQTPVITLTVSGPQTFTPLFEPAGKETLRPGDVVITNLQFDSDNIEGAWFELLVARPGGVDLRGWRITDNDTKTATDEGSLIFTNHEDLARVPHGATILVVTSRTPANDAQFPRDDLAAGPSGRMVVYAGNDHLDAETDPWFNLAPNDNLVVLAPGPTPAFGDDQGIAFTTIGHPRHPAVTPASFGILADGVTAGMPTVY